MTSLGGLLQIILIVVLLGRGICECMYGATFNQGFTDCPGYSNKVLKATNMQLEKSTDNGADNMFLAGSLEILKQINDGLIIIEVSKETEIGDEPMWTCSADLCTSLKDEDAPWAAAMQEMGLTSCPVKEGTYHCKNMTLDMSFMNDLFNENTLGEYSVQMCIEDSKLNKVTCHNLGVTVTERKEK